MKPKLRPEFAPAGACEHFAVWHLILSGTLFCDLGRKATTCILEGSQKAIRGGRDNNLLRLRGYGLRTRKLTTRAVSAPGRTSRSVDTYEIPLPGERCGIDLEVMGLQIPSALARQAPSVATRPHSIRP